MDAVTPRRCSARDTAWCGHVRRSGIGGNRDDDVGDIGDIDDIDIEIDIDEP